MKEMRNYVLGLSCVMLLANPVSTFAAEDDDANLWVAKGAVDVFSIDSNFSTVQNTKADVSGELYGGTFSIGRVLQTQLPSMIILDASIRSGDISFSSQEGERSDNEFTLTYQFLGERFQPYVSLGYWSFEQTASGNYSYYDGTNVYPIYVEDKTTIDSFNVGGGLGVSLPDAGPVQFSAKLDLALLFASGQGDQDSTNFGHEEAIWESDATGFRWKASGLANYPLELGSFPGGLFAEIGYLNQNIDFGTQYISGSRFDFDLEWNGPYARIGLYLLF